MSKIWYKRNPLWKYRFYYNKGRVLFLKSWLLKSPGPYQTLDTQDTLGM